MRSFLAAAALVALTLTPAPADSRPTFYLVDGKVEARGVPAKTADCQCGEKCKCDPCRCAAPADPSTAAVLVRCGSAAGSGTCLASEGGTSLVLTNRHVVADGGVTTVEVGGKSYAASVLTQDGAADLAVVIVSAALPVAEVADAEPAPGVVVRQWGRAWYGQGRAVPKEGRFVGRSSARDTTGAEVVLTTISSESGDSGAGVFADGRLVAVNWGGLPGRQHCVGLGDVLRVLRATARDRFPRLAARLDAVRAKAADAKAATKAGADAAVGEVDWRGDYTAAAKEAAERGVPFVVYVTADACGFCKKMEAKTLTDPAVLARLAGCVAVKISADNRANAPWLAAFRVASYPCTLVFRPDMTEAARARGFVDAAALVDKLEAAVQK